MIHKSNTSEFVAPCIEDTFEEYQKRSEEIKRIILRVENGSSYEKYLTMRIAPKQSSEKYTKYKFGIPKTSEMSLARLAVCLFVALRIRSL